MGPLEAGLWTAPSAAGFIVGSQLAPVLVRRARPAYVMTGALVIVALGFGILAQADSSDGLAVLVTGYVVLSLGLAPVFTLATDLIVGAAPPEQAGAASAIAETSSELGGALGIAILGSIVTAIYRSAMASSVPSGVSQQVAEAAQDTLAGALAASQALPSQAAAALLHSGREAFADAFEVTALLCAAIALAAAALTMILLRSVGSGDERERDEVPEAAHAAASKAERAPVGAARASCS
jgi:DHA2 family multidrug resistance protein-like MFS transporter